MKKIASIMIIDDEPVNNFICRKTIEHFDPNIDVLEFDKAKDALNYFLEQTKKKQQSLPDIVFLDLNMPLMDGWEFLEEYKKLAKEFQSRAVVVMLTTSENPNDMMKARLFNEISEFKTKPLTKETLEEILEKYFPH